MKKTGVILMLALLLAASLAAGVVHLFQLRFERGDIYPPYSTLRTDPLGASALFESLDRLPQLIARRYFEQTFKESDGHERTLMVLGLEPSGLEGMSRTEFSTLQQFAYNGGRVVLSYAPLIYETTTNRDHPLWGGKEKNVAKEEKTKPSQKPAPASKTDKSGDDKKKPAAKSPPDESDDQGDDPHVFVDDASPQKEWGFQTKLQSLATNDDGTVQFPAAHHTGPADGLPPELAVHTALYFTALTNGWTTVYERDQLPVVIERRLGKGSVLLVADSYYFSNEAMLKDRETGLLAWTIGGGREVIFDEAHLGVWVDPGVASLMRKYHLHGLIFSLLLLAGLFVWKNSTSLVPPVEAVVENLPAVAGRDAMAGFVNLLRRGIPRAEILNRIFEEWRKTRHRSHLSPAHRQEIENLMQQENARSAKERQPLAAYRAISTLLHRRR